MSPTPPSAGEVRVVLKAIKQGEISDSSYVTESGAYQLHLRDLNGSTISSNIPKILNWLGYWDNKDHQDPVLAFKGKVGLPGV